MYVATMPLTTPHTISPKIGYESKGASNTELSQLSSELMLFISRQSLDVAEPPQLLGDFIVVFGLVKMSDFFFENMGDKLIGT